MPAQYENSVELPEDISEEPEPYIGSVRFFKHVILSVVAALILIPTVFAVVMTVRFSLLSRNYRALSAAYDVSRKEYAESADQAKEEISALQTQIEEANQALAMAADVPSMQEPEFYEEVLSIPFDVDLNDWRYFLVNDSHPLPKDYSVTLVRTRHGKDVAQQIKAPLEEMLDAARAAGHSLVICSAYRGFEKQTDLMEDSIERLMANGMSYEEAFYETKRSIAATGTSEHHTGLAVDIVGVRHQSLDASQAHTKEAVWLAEHAHEYGFVVRYPDGKEDITGISYESWHFRYVGVEAASFMKENGLCLEEFLELAALQQKE